MLKERPHLSSTVDVTVVRWIDGYRIEFTRHGLTNSQAEDLHMVEKILPGTLAGFYRTPTPRPWQTTDPAL